MINRKKSVHATRPKHLLVRLSRFMSNNWGKLSVRIQLILLVLQRLRKRKKKKRIKKISESIAHGHLLHCTHIHKCVSVYMYMACSKSNAFYFIMLTHSVKGGCWWCISRDSTFLSITYDFSLSLIATDWQNSIWHENVHKVEVCYWISHCGTKIHPLTCSDACWMFMETKYWI